MPPYIQYCNSISTSGGHLEWTFDMIIYFVWCHKLGKAKSAPCISMHYFCPRVIMYCPVYGCNSDSQNKSTANLSFFTFPSAKNNKEKCNQEEIKCGQISVNVRISNLHTTQGLFPPLLQWLLYSLAFCSIFGFDWVQKKC